MLEARDRVGGRIHTLRDNTFSRPVEAGAEFIHGDLKRTKALLKEAKISFDKGEGRMWNVFKGELEEGDFFSEHWDELLEKLKSLKHDMPIAEFLKHYFGDAKYDELRREHSTNSFLVTTLLIPAKPLRLGFAMSGQATKISQAIIRVGGYGTAIDFLKTANATNKKLFFISQKRYQHIEWESQHVKVTTERGRHL